ncbi:MAG: hypothetical protein EBZ53_02660 [Verrucomicrobia bacterium]|nr:hypothetical protein [Verrucomicrobiota bacterium]
MEFMKYVSLLMNYIEQEYDNIPESVTPEMEEYFLESFNRCDLIPNAAGMFHEIFLRAKA